MQENFYQNGYIELDYLNNDIINIFNKRLRDLISLEDQWKKKYKFTKDLKFEYLKAENIFFDYLFKNDFHNKINQITTKKLILTNIQVRTCFKGLSYMTWHRDTYRSKEKIIGPFMPCFKLMVYPNLYNIKSKEISLIAKSMSDSSRVISDFSKLFQREIFGFISGKTSNIAEYKIGFVGSSLSMLIDGDDAGLILFSWSSLG